MKGISPLISSILIIGIYLSLIFLAYTWGVPIAEKNADIPTLNKAEYFLSTLSKEIDDVIRFKNKEKIVFDLPGQIYIDPKKDQIYFSLLTRDTIYSSDSFICFSKNCNLTQATIGQDSFYILGVNVTRTQYEAINDYYLIFRYLTSGDYIYRIDLISLGNSTIVGGKGSKLLIENCGTKKEQFLGGEKITTFLNITFM